MFAPPALTRTWFHFGPVENGDDRWTELDLSPEYWLGDPPLLGADGTGSSAETSCGPCAPGSCAASCTDSTTTSTGPSTHGPRRAPAAVIHECHHMSPTALPQDSH